MPETDPDPLFLGVFRAYVGPGEFVTARALATRMFHEDARGNPMWLSAFTRVVSRKLSNLNRLGHLDRRPAGQSRELEYRLAARARQNNSREPGRPL